MLRTAIDIDYTEQEETVARYAKALGHPVRIRILKLLSDRACCYNGDLTEEIPMAQSTISQHLKALKDAGLIQGEILPPRVKYCINKANWQEAKNLFRDLLK
ncbi:MAG: winged helix-turn-helix transcriptional regulator [Flavobacteriales bacterium]|nr:winged helix-turn-helix transcriptional regulator [Flavobacteriales bacterium]